MRDILDKLLLTEATGITGRKQGDAFESDKGIIYFNKVEAFPSSGGILTPEELEAEIQNIEADGTVIQWVNPAFKKQAAGFVLAFFDRDDQHSLGPGTEVFGRFFKQIHGFIRQNTWNNNDIPGYKLAIKASKKSASGMTPQDILGSKLDNLKPVDVVKAVIEKFGSTHPLSEMVSAVVSGGPYPISVSAPADITFEAFRDYYCEILQPLALMSGSVTNIEGALERFLGDENPSSALVSYGSSKTNGLSDSILTTPSGRELKISTKGGKGGASASVNNILDVVDEIMTNFTSTEAKKFLNKHKEAIQIARVISSGGYRQSPITLAVKFGLINTDEGEIVENLYSLERHGLVAYSTALTAGNLTNRLKRLYASRTSTKPAEASAYAHLITVLASAVAEHINNKTSFSDSVSEILNHGALIQVYSSVSQRSGIWALNGFEGEHPGTTTTGVIVDTKHYASTKLKGNFTFKILRGGATVEEAGLTDTADEDQPSVSTVDKPVQPGQSSDIKAADATKVAPPSDAVYGRTKRSKG